MPEDKINHVENVALTGLGPMPSRIVDREGASDYPALMDQSIGTITASGMSFTKGGGESMTVAIGSNISVNSISIGFNRGYTEWVSTASAAGIAISTVISQHSNVLSTAVGEAAARNPVAIIWVSPTHSTIDETANRSLSHEDIAYYESLASRLEDINALGADAPVDRGAVETAEKVLNELKVYRLPPPGLTWHGGDAVVMLWQLGDTTFAITITDGRFGYVVRSNRKTIRKDHSIPIETFSPLTIS